MPRAPAQSIRLFDPTRLGRDGLIASKIIWDKASRDPLWYIWNCCFTKDEHDPNVRAKPFPRYEYIAKTVRLWQARRLLCIVKSRQLMFTWIFAAIATWDARFRHNRDIYLQSKKEDDAARIRDRCWFILQNEPRLIRGWHWEGRELQPLGLGRGEQPPEVSFRGTNSTITGIPEGGDQIRSRVPSGLVMDEFAFQPAARDAYRAARPAIDGDSWIAVISTPNPGTMFEELAFDRIPQEL